MHGLLNGIRSDAATPLIASETTASGGSSNPNSLPSTTTNIRANPTMSRNLGKPVSDEQKAILQDKVIAAIELVTRKIGEMASLETELCVVELAQNKHLVAWKKLFTRSNKALDDQNLHEHFVAEMCASMRVLLADKERDGTPDVVIHLESFRLEREVARLLRLKKRFNVLKKKHDKANDLVYAADVERKGLQGRFEVYHTEWTGIVKHMFAVREAFYAAGGSVDAVYDMELMRLVNEYGAHLRKDAESRKKGKE